MVTLLQRERKDDEKLRHRSVSAGEARLNSLSEIMGEKQTKHPPPEKKKEHQIDGLEKHVMLQRDWKKVFLGG